MLILRQADDNGNIKTSSQIPSGKKVMFGGKQMSRVFFKDSSMSAFLMVYQYDNVPPTISFSKTSGQTTVTQYFELTGTIVDSHSGVKSVTVNNSAVSLSGNSFKYAVNLSYGTNNFTIVATDNANNKSSASFSITYVNQKSNSSFNWTSFRNNGNVADNNYTKEVYVNGKWYPYYKNSHAESGYDHDLGGYHHVDCWADIETSIPLPKGLSYVSFNGHCIDYFRIKDASTGTYIASNTNSNSISANINTTQAQHALYLEFKSSNYNYSYQYARADSGITSHTFKYY